MEDTTIPTDVANDEPENIQPEVAAPLSQRDEVIAAIAARRNPSAPVEEETIPAVEEIVEDVPEPPKARLVKVKINGEEREVTEEEVIAHGIKTLQKESAADERLRRAALIEKNLIEREGRIREELKKIKQPGESHKDVAKRFAAAIMDDDEKASEIFAEVLDRQERTEAALRDVLGAQRQTAEHLKTQKVQKMTKLAHIFSEKYPSLVGDKDLINRANRRTIELQNERPDLSEEEIVIQAGKDVVDWLGSFVKPRQEETPNPKRDMPRPVKTAASRLPAKPEEKRQTRADVIKEMRERRNPHAQ